MRRSSSDISLCDYVHVFESDAGETRRPGEMCRDTPYTTVTITPPLIRRRCIPDDVRFREMPLQQYDDQEFLLRIYLRSMNWSFVSSPLCYYVHHGESQITDERKRSPRPWYETFNSLYDDFRDLRSTLPDASIDLIWTIGIQFSKRLLHKQMRREARSICRRLLRRPRRVNNYLTAVRILAESYEPEWMFRGIRSLRPRRRSTGNDPRPQP